MEEIYQITSALKHLSFGKQVAVLCPTTILAQQHLNTFRTRLAPYPVKVEMMSRFVSKMHADETIKGLADGTVDIVIGTHKLLGKTIKFENLGLLVRPDGALVTAGAMDRALAGLEGVALYQVNQPDASEVVVDVVVEAEAPASLTRDVEGALASLALGLRVTARRVTAIAAESSGKFRIARRHFPLDLGLVVPGANGVSA